MGLAERGEAASQHWGKKRMPRQKPGKSEQSVGTPWSLIKAIEYRFGWLSWDLAASKDNAKCENYITLDPKPPAEKWTHDLEGVVFGNSLKVDWHALDDPFFNEGFLFLNPPFGDIAPWAEKAYRESLLGAKIFLLTPLACAEWYQDWILGKAYVIMIGRVRFEGHTADFPKDLMISWFNSGIRGSELWRWKETLKRHEQEPV